MRLETRRPARNWPCCATSSTRTSCSTRSIRSARWCCSSRPSRPTRCSPVLVPALYAGQRAGARVTVAQEVETLKLYLDIERMRFEERLRTAVSASRMTIRTILVDDENWPSRASNCGCSRSRCRDHRTLRQWPRGDPRHQDPKPDLVFLDIQMPGFDGFSVVKGLWTSIRRCSCSSPPIMSTR
jgi:CheY-like chemotaxis protein